jgi:alkylation response protein AidB-like acyl-CoA dehydrogenase
MARRRRTIVIDDRMMRGSGRSAVAWAAAGFAGGVVLGAALYAQQAHQHARALFSHVPIRRYLALGYLRGQPSVDTVRLLRDYLDWEKSPRLRKRAQEVLRSVEEDLA